MWELRSLDTAAGEANLSEPDFKNTVVLMRAQSACPESINAELAASDDLRYRKTNPAKRAPNRNLMLQVGVGALVGVASFVALGTVAAVWENPFFIRMTPVQGFEIPLLAAMSILFGLYVVVRRPVCGNKFTGLGGIVGFVGIACPICNKILLLVFGGELLMLYLEPSRLWFSIAGVAMVGGAVVRELWKRRRNDDGAKTLRARSIAVSASAMSELAREP